MKSLETAFSIRATSSLAATQEMLAKQIRSQMVSPALTEAIKAATANIDWTRTNVLNTMRPFAQIAAIQSAQIEQALAPTLRTHRLMMENIAQSVRPISIPRSALPTLDFSALVESMKVTQQWKTLAEQIYEQAMVDLPRFEEVTDLLEDLPQGSPSTSLEPADDYITVIMGLAIWIALHVYIVVGDDSENVFLGVAVSIIDLLTAPTALKAIKDFNEFLNRYDPT